MSHQWALEGATVSENVSNRYLTVATLTLCYILGEVAHFQLGVVAREVARDVGYGEKSCYGVNETWNGRCAKYGTEKSCLSLVDHSSTSDSLCEYLYNGQGIEYQLLAGPAFMVMFTTAGLVCGVLADKTNRPRLLAFCTLLFAIGGVGTGLATKYWHLLILRMLIAIGESACRPVSVSLIADYFIPSGRGMANAVFSFGIMLGFGLTFVIGNYVNEVPPWLTDVFVSVGGDVGIQMDDGWRLAFFVGCGPAFLVALMVLLIKEPRRRRHDSILRYEQQLHYGAFDEEPSSFYNGSLVPPKDGVYFRNALRAFLKPTILVLLVGAAIRQTGGETWAYNTQLYFEEYYPSYNPGLWLAVCPVLGGCQGLLLGGFLSDWAVRSKGVYARLWVMAGTMILAFPFGCGVLLLEPPWAYVSLLIYFTFAETWTGILFTVLVELHPGDIHSFVVAMFLFLMNNTGGNLPVVVAPIASILGLRAALIIMFPSMVLLSGMLFFLSSLPLYFRSNIVLTTSN